jgi:hypothetical protein
MAELQGFRGMLKAECLYVFLQGHIKMGPIRIHLCCDSSPCSVCDRKVHRAYPGLLIFNLALYEKAKR